MASLPAIEKVRSALRNYSRLAIDCNRMPGSKMSIVELSELTIVPGNIGLSPTQVEARVQEIFAPYHDRIARELDARRQAGRPTALVAMHSFTPVFKAVDAAVACRRALRP
jgi:predicted N-formylglutamate amidohydrolase